MITAAPLVQRYGADAMLCLGHSMGAGVGATGMRWRVPDAATYPIWMAPIHALADSPGTAPASPPSPTFVTASAFLQSNNAASLTPSVSGLQANDIILAECNIAGNVAGSTFFSPPAGEGWTQINGQLNPAFPGLNQQVFWKRWGAGFTDDSSPTFTLQNAVNGETRNIVLSVYRGCATSGNPFDDITTQNSSGTTTLTAPSATSAGSNRTVVRMYCSNQTVNLNGFSGGVNTAYAGSAYGASTDPRDVAVASSWLSGYGIGATGTGSVGGGGGSGSIAVCTTIVLKPPPPPPANDSVTTPTLAAPAVNDILIAAVHRTGSGVFPTPPGGQGWTFLASGSITTGTDALLGLWWKRWGVGFTDDVTPTWTIADANNTPWGVMISRWRRCRALLDPYDDVAVATGTGTTLTAPDVTSLGSHRSVARFYLAVGSTSLTTFSAGESTIYGTAAYGASNGGISRAVAGRYKEDVGAGPVGTATASPGANNWVAITVVLRPN